MTNPNTWKQDVNETEPQNTSETPGASSESTTVLAPAVASSVQDIFALSETALPVALVAPLVKRTADSLPWDNKFEWDPIAWAYAYEVSLVERYRGYDVSRNKSPVWTDIGNVTSFSFNSANTIVMSDISDNRPSEDITIEAIQVRAKNNQWIWTISRLELI